MAQADRVPTSRSWAWALVLLLLVSLRIPSLAQPAGGDQWLYTYVAHRVLDGGVPYRDAFEQKPPAIFFVYAAMWGMWPHESVVAAADLAAAALTAWLLVGLGRRMFGGRTGEGAAALFLLLGDPGIQRLGGLNVRAQCEAFVALAITAALALIWRAERRRWHLLVAGVCFGVAFWLKYNAAAYIVAVLAATAAAQGGEARDRRRRVTDLGWVAAGAIGVGAAVLTYFAAAGALTDLWLGTVGYNLAYSGETYRGIGHALQYVATMPVQRAFVDGLWYLGGAGAVLVLITRGTPLAPRLTVLAWVGACVCSIAINGSRGLPQYFVQAAPALALAAAAGWVLAWRRRTARSAGGTAMFAACVVCVMLGLWRVGIEPTRAWRPRLFGLPQAWQNLAFDLRSLRGAVNGETYLRRFGREDAGKFSPLSVERLAEHVRDSTRPDESVLVFGFASGGVLVKSGRPSASRFFWSRPIVLEFERDRPGFGSAGLLVDLQRTRPAVVALQKRDWGLAEPNVQDSLAFFMTKHSLRIWLQAGYEPDYEDAAFVVWRRKG